MRYLFVLLVLIGIAITSCRKKEDCSITATITQSGLSCSNWGIQVGNTYPSANIPDEFKQEGLQVCVSYELYEDMRACACCGGTWANIKFITLPAD